MEILLKLNVKSVVRFKSLSKSWLSLISDSRFRNLYFDRSSPTEKLLIISIRVLDLTVPSIDFNAPLNRDSYSYFEFEVPGEVFQPGIFKFGGCCRGFVLLDCLEHLCLWNPRTGFHKKVCRPPIDSNKELSRNLLFQGLGYDPLTDDYLVIQLFASITIYLQTHAKVFSIRANKWMENESTDLFFTYSQDYDTPCRVVNHVIHWLSSCLKEEIIVGFILAFDVAKRKFFEIASPIVFGDGMDEMRVLSEIEGLLSLNVYTNSKLSIDIWVMKEYRVECSWSKSIAVSLVDHVPQKFFFPVCVTKDGDIVGNDLCGLFKFNNKGQLKEMLSYQDVSAHLHVEMYQESFLSLPCPND